MEDFFKIIGAIVASAIIILTIPALMFGLGYFEGWLVKMIIGTQFTNAFNTAFNTTYFRPEYIPYLGGVLGWIGGFFKTTSSSKRK